MENYTNLLEKLIPGLVRIFQGSITSIILYGSVARGTQTEESDIDIAVLVGSYTKEMHEQMTDLVVDLELEYDYDKFTEWENVMPFYKNVKKEGIVLWPAA